MIIFKLNTFILQSFDARFLKDFDNLPPNYGCPRLALPTGIKVIVF